MMYSTGGRTHKIFSVRHLFCLTTALVSSSLFFSGCGEIEKEEEAELDSPVLENEILKGLTAWRKPGNIQEGASCSSCHSPDAFDLAFFDISDNDLIRRAEPHIGREESQKIVELVHAIRKKYNIVNPEDRHTFRLMQPGPDGQVLPGNTIEERELAFGKDVLPKFIPSIMSGEITSKEDAERAIQELNSIDIRDVAIGIPLPLWSNDAFHGAEFASIDEWLPSFPCLSTSDEYTRLQDTYIANPSENNFWAMFNSAKELTNCGVGHENKQPDDAHNVEKHKFYSMLIGQHIMRNKVMGVEGFIEDKVAFRRIGQQKVHNFNAASTDHKSIMPSQHIWAVAEFARKPQGSHGFGGFGETIRGTMHKIGYPEEIYNSQHTHFEGRELGKKDYERLFLTSWFWLHKQFHEARFVGYFNGGAAGMKYYLHASFSQMMDRTKRDFSEQEGYRSSTKKEMLFRTGRYSMTLRDTQSEEYQKIMKKMGINYIWARLYKCAKIADDGEIAGDQAPVIGLAQNVLFLQQYDPNRGDEAEQVYRNIFDKIVAHRKTSGIEPLEGDADYFLDKAGKGHHHGTN